MPDSPDLIDAIERHVGVSGSRQRGNFTVGAPAGAHENSELTAHGPKAAGFPPPPR